MYSGRNNNQDKHENKGEDKKHKGHSPLKHIGMMGACCLIPILIMGILPLLQINNLGTNKLIAGISSLICPVMMVIMMIGMFKSGKRANCCSDNKEEVNEENK